MSGCMGARRRWSKFSSGATNGKKGWNKGTAANASAENGPNSGSTVVSDASPPGTVEGASGNGQLRATIADGVSPSLVAAGAPRAAVSVPSVTGDGVPTTSIDVAAGTAF